MPFTVLLVCTGNICRSAFAERLGRAYLDEALGQVASAIGIASAGTQAVVGSAIHPDTALVLRGFGGDPDGFSARQLTDGQIMDADLVLTMTRQHRRDVLTLAPRALARTYTVIEAADLLRLMGNDVPPAGADFPQNAAELVKAMSSARSLRTSSESDDVPDPIGESVPVHQAAGEAIAGALLPVLQRLVALAHDGTTATCGPQLGRD